VRRLEARAGDLDVGADRAFGAEVEHLLCLADSADPRPGERPALGEQGEHPDRQGFGRRADVDEGSVGGQQAEERVDVERRADGVEDQVEAAGEADYGSLVAR
jgi:hypothetical protein